MKYLMDTKQSELMYVLKAFVTASTIALCFATVIVYLFPNAKASGQEFDTLTAFLLLVLVGTIAETLIMIPIFAAIKLFTKNIVKIAFVSALIWAGIHSFSPSVWGLVTFSSFFIYSLAFLNWDSISRKKAIYITFGIHALKNASAFILLKYIS